MRGKRVREKRPLGIKTIALLMIISGIVSIISGVIGLGGLLVLSTVSKELGNEKPGIGLMGISVFVTALGVATMVIAWGLLKSKRWAWTMTVIISIISIIASIGGMILGGYHQIIDLILYGIIFGYLYRPDVREYFTKKKISP
jgi:hypothetical protein